MTHHRTSFLLTFCLFASLLSGCASFPGVETLFPSATPTRTFTPTASPTVTFTPTYTPTLTPTPRTPPVLPAVFIDGDLTPYGTPHTYILDTCQYLRDKWSSQNSIPGTVVMVIMFHSIASGPVTDPNQITEFNFRHLMDTLHDNGFEAINTTQLAGFMESNAKIPPRSVLLVVDDRRTKQYYDRFFRQYWQDWGWPVVNAWISTDQSTADLWAQQEELNTEGWVDYQAHGYVHNVAISDNSSDAYIQSELQKPFDIFQEHFNKKPIAVIWPGGGFTPHSVEVARSLGYQLGFTTNPRGPLMFNWVPLVDEKNPQQPTWLAEGTANDPLLVLPRYWAPDAVTHIDAAMRIGQEAAAYAGQNKSIELDYYNIVCSPKLGQLP